MASQKPCFLGGWGIAKITEALERVAGRKFVVVSSSFVAFFPDYAGVLYICTNAQAAVVML
jgi:hypothetical protein